MVPDGACLRVGTEVRGKERQREIGSRWQYQPAVSGLVQDRESLHFV